MLGLKMQDPFGSTNQVEQFGVNFKKAKISEEGNPSERAGVVKLGLGQSLKNCK